MEGRLRIQIDQRVLVGEKVNGVWTWPECSYPDLVAAFPALTDAAPMIEAFVRRELAESTTVGGTR